MDKKEYKELSDRKTLSSTLFKDSLMAFLSGGLICTLGQVLFNVYKAFDLGEEITGSAVSVTLIFLGVLLTGLNIYPKIAKHAGAGTVVPITGFANSVAAPSIEARTEGMVLGVGAKLFTVAGPVIVYGIGASFLAGFWYWILSLL